MPVDVFSSGILHTLIRTLVSVLVLCLFVRALLTWIPALPESNVVVRFFRNITGPVLDPIQYRLPPMSLGAFDLRSTLAYFLAWFALSIVSAALLSALPAGW